MASLHGVLTRRTPQGAVAGPAERLDLLPALEAMTYNGAFLSFEEDFKGRLATGLAADVAVLDRNILGMEPDEMLAAKCDLTLIAGRVAFDRQGEMARR